MKDCIFCKIMKGELPSDTIFEDENFKVILNAFPATKGHLLIIPKTHFANIYDLDEATGSKLFSLAIKISASMKNLPEVKGLNILQNNDVAAGQTVMHFHMHLIPRYDLDTVDIKWDTVEFDKIERSKLLESIVNLLSDPCIK